ncbi:hypothetical protein TNCV_1117451 [Trichonephila clavipes]|nr:hypothetical protein TNCV_1117451 [Trichonephila clavipes]
MSKRCGECEQTKFTLEKDSADFRIWCEGHQDICSATHVGSSGAMEVKALRALASAFRNRVLIAVSSAISEFNVGTLKSLKTFQYANYLATSLSSEHLAYLTD